MTENIKVSYDGNYPNLCSGKLVVTIDDKVWVFPDYCMRSGGGVWFDNGWSEHVDRGEWTIREWPDGFPVELQDAVTNAVNCEISHGCCGGCV
jgi:hypothetical protein